MNELFIKLFIILFVGFVIFMCAKMYYKYRKKSMPQNLGVKIFGCSILYTFSFVHTIICIVIVLAIYFIALIFGKRDFTFNKFIFTHLPIAVIILVLINIMGVAMKTQY